MCLSDEAGGGLIDLSIHSLLSNCLQPQCSQKESLAIFLMHCLNKFEQLDLSVATISHRNVTHWTLEIHMDDMKKYINT